MRSILRLPPHLAPFKIAILPLMKKDGLAEKSEEIFLSLKAKGISCDMDISGSVGKRYFRQDANGTPWCVTVDYETLENATVTIRNRDTAEQNRIKLEEIDQFLK